MRSMAPVIFFVVFYLCSCSNKENSITTNEIALTHNRFYEYKCDDYPLDDSMFYSIDDIEIRNLKSCDKWFTNDSLQQTLVFDIYTDYHRMDFYHFNHELPDDLKTMIPFEYVNDTKGDVVEKNKEILNHFNEFIARAKKINKSYFTSKRNIYLGKQKNEILMQMGDPNSVSWINDVEILLWKPINGTSNTEMFFRNNNLIAIFYENNAI